MVYGEVGSVQEVVGRERCNDEEMYDKEGEENKRGNVVLGRVCKKRKGM